MSMCVCVSGNRERGEDGWLMRGNISHFGQEVKLREGKVDGECLSLELCLWVHIMVRAHRTRNCTKMRMNQGF